MKKRSRKEKNSNASGNPPKDRQQKENPAEIELLFQGISNPKKRRFLAAFAQCGSVTEAAKRAKVHWSSHYKWLKEEDNVAYTDAFNRSREIAGDIAEGEIYRRAFLGFDHPVIYEGEITTTYKDFSDRPRNVFSEGLKARTLQRKPESLRERRSPGRRFL